MFLGILSVISGFFFSNASLVGKAGISLFYRQYRFLKIWWQGGLLVFGVLLVLFLLQGWAQNKWSRRSATIFHISMVITGLAGWYLTYYDFQHTMTHSMLGERFHLGAYLFWLGWLATSLFFLVSSRKELLKTQDETDL